MYREMTVREYAESRGKNDSTVRKIIGAKVAEDPFWELKENPTDARQRIMTPEQQEALDKEKGWKPVVPENKIEQYERTEEIDAIICQGEIVERQVETASLARAEENPLVQALKTRLQERKASNQAALTRVDQQMQSDLDVDQAVQALSDLDAVDAGEEKAIREFELEQKAYLRKKAELKMRAAGLQQPVQEEPQNPTKQEIEEEVKKPSPETQQWPV